MADEPTDADYAALLPPEPPDGHVAWSKVRFNAGHKNPLAKFVYGEGKIPFQTTIAACFGSQYLCERVCRAGYMKFDEGLSHEEVKAWRDDIYAQFRELKNPGGDAEPKPKRSRAAKEPKEPADPGAAGETEPKPKRSRAPKEPTEPADTSAAAAATSSTSAPVADEESICKPEPRYDAHTDGWVVQYGPPKKLKRLFVSVKRCGGSSDLAKKGAESCIQVFTPGLSDLENQSIMEAKRSEWYTLYADGKVEEKDEVKEEMKDEVKDEVKDETKDEAKERKKSKKESKGDDETKESKKSKKEHKDDAKESKKEKKAAKEAKEAKDDAKPEPPSPPAASPPAASPPPVDAEEKQDDSLEDIDITEDAPADSDAWQKVRLGGKNNCCMFYIDAVGDKKHFQTTIPAAGDSEEHAMRIGRLCYDKLVTGITIEEVKAYRDRLYRSINPNFKISKKKAEGDDGAPAKRRRTAATSETKMHAKLKKLGKLEGALHIFGRSEEKRNAPLNGYYTLSQDGHDGFSAYEKVCGKHDKLRFLYYSAGGSRWRISDTMGAEKGFAYLKVDDRGLTPPLTSQHTQTWHVYDGKGEGYGADPDIKSNSISAEAPQVANSAPDAVVKEEDEEAVSSSSSSSKSSSESSADESAEDEDAPPTKAGDGGTNGTRPKRRGMVCAKMLARSMLRCHCHFIYLRNCPARGGV